MAGPAIHALSVPQWGLEGTSAPNQPGAAVAATKKMAVKDFLIRPTDTIVREQILKGLAIANRGNEVIVERGTEWEVPSTPLVPDEFHYWAGMAFVGPTKSGVGPFVWTATHDPLTVQARHLRTIELRLADGSANSDWEIPACFLQELEIVGAAGKPIMFSAKGAGRRLATSTLTPALALPGIAEFPTALSKLYIDNTWTNRGTTQITGQITGWRFRVSTGLKGQITADGRADQDLTVVVFDPDEFKYSVEIDFKALAASAVWQTEKTASESQLDATRRRVVEIRADVTNAIAYQLKLQAILNHSQASLFPVERSNGEVMGKFVMEGSTDDTNTLAMIIQNNVTAAIA